MRPTWSGSLSFGLITIPVQLVTATVDLDAHFRQLHAPDGSRVEQHPFCPEEDLLLDRSDVARAYPVEDGQMVIVEDADLEAVASRQTRTIGIESFCRVDEIDPILRDRSYLVLPAGETEGSLRSYRLLARTLQELGVGAVGRFVMRTRESLVVIDSEDERLRATTLFYADELLDRSDIPGASANGDLGEPVANLSAVVEELSVPWSEELLEDRHRARVREVIERHAREEGTIEAPVGSEPEPEVPDLIGALQQTIASARAARGFDGMTREELYEQAKKENVPGRSRMTKEQLISALEERNGN